MNEEAAALHAILLVNGTAIPSLAVLEEYFQIHFPSDLSFTREEVDEDALTFWAGEQMFAISSMDAPYPKEELPELCDQAWWWPDAAQRSVTHDNHLVVSLLGVEDPVQSALLLTQLTCAVVANTSAVGVIWGAAEAIHAAEEFVEVTLSVQREDPPIPLNLWINIQGGVDDEGQSALFTVGFEALGYHEVEVQGSNCTLEELIDIVVPLMLYIVQEDVVFEDGATFGSTEEERIPVSYGPSLIDEDREVLILDIT